MTNEVVDIIEKKEKQKKTLKSFLIDIFDIFAFLLFVLWIVLIIRIFLFNPFTVVWHSMDPTFKESDFIIVDKLSPRFSDYERWDIIIFLPPAKDVNYIKRIIWMPWETVRIKDWKVYICDENDSWIACEELDEPYLPDDSITEASCWVDEFEVKSWSYFVLWDNRDKSTDARCCFGLWCFNSDSSSYLLTDKDMLWRVSVRLFPDFSRF